MLKLELTLISLLLLPVIFNRCWWQITAALSTMLLMSLNLIQHTSYNMVTPWTAMDPLSATLIILSMWITAMMMMASTKIMAMQTSRTQFMLTTITLLTILVNCFCASNMISFYIWFEGSLIPTMVLIMCWGYQPERSQASMYLMLYTVAASLPLLGAICKIFFSSNTLMMPMAEMFILPQVFTNSYLAWLLMTGGFLVKLPLFSVHLWLPKAHVEAPVAGSMVLAAILLKLGGYGYLRLSFLFPSLSKTVSPLISSIALCGAVLTSLTCLRQTDLKSLIAYSSIGHMGLMIAGACSNTQWGLMAAMAMMIAHGLTSSALFMMANISYETTSTRSLFLIKGLMTMAPTMTMWWFLFAAANMAAPPSINLFSEIMLITSIISTWPMAMILVALSSFLSAAYSLYMYSSTQHGHMSSFSNPLHLAKQKDYLAMLMHLYPAIIIIMKPELISAWL